MPSANRVHGRIEPAGAQTIYVIDDDEAVRDSLVLLLESHGLAAKAYESGRSFLADYRLGQDGCLVLDLHMPEMSGIDLLEQFAPGALDIPVIVISGRADTVTKARAAAAGANVILDKPFRDQDLLSATELQSDLSAYRATAPVRSAPISPDTPTDVWRSVGNPTRALPVAHCQKAALL